ncbi:MAG: hypothetical protein AABW48_06055 [Nanoarchaeota archaeon]
MRELIQAIKKKKELSQISESFVRKELQHYLSQNPKLKSPEQLNPRSANYKQIVKGVRARLRRVYGLFREELDPKKRSAEEILQMHSSTKERLSFYPELYRKLFEITNKPKSIIDLGCGVNPFSISFMKLKQLDYYAYDLSKDEIKRLNKFFKQIHQKNPFFNGTGKVLDISNLTGIPPADLCFLFKMTDILDQGKGHKVTEEIIRKVPAKFVVVSFPTKTMSGKRMNYPRRKWIELMCQRLNYEVKIIEFSNELFYVIKK